MTVALNINRTSVEVSWDPGDSGAESVTLYAQGDDGEWHNTSEMKNDGLGELTYPEGFEGSSLVEVRDQDGNVIDTGRISYSPDAGWSNG